LVYEKLVEDPDMARQTSEYIVGDVTAVDEATANSATAH
jgi:hypothetical protein